MRALSVVVLAFILAASSPASARAAWLIPPVDGPIARRFEAPASSWGPGHRGIDYAVPEGTAVRAVAGGTVTFAGDVAGTDAVTISHSGGVESTYTDLGHISVTVGDVVEQGYWLGSTARSHAFTGSEGMHLGIKVGGDYVDPETLMGPLDTSLAIRLAPLVWEPPGTLPAVFRAPFLSARSVPMCEAATTAGEGPPNDNVAILVAGIGSRTAGGTSAALYESDALGYAEEDTYAFSYRGSSGPELHEPYERSDTFGDVRKAAQRLRDLVTRISRRHPSRGIDLVAHSQGGIVARTFLQMSAEAWDPDLPPIEHLVTFSTPHGGAPLAAGVPVLNGTAKGRAMLLAASVWSGVSGPIPDPFGASVGQLAPGSDLLGRLDDEAVLFGTRVLSLGIANDAVVPADKAVWDGYTASVVPPAGLNGHDAVVTSALANGIARRFLRDGPATCTGAWDLWGPRVGRAIGIVERALPWLLRR